MLGNKKIIAIVGPTASGKSDLAIAVAKKYNGEVISADSRQVYRGMDVGTGKVTRDLPSNAKIKIQNPKFISGGIVHHVLDVASPKRRYNVSHFVRDAKIALEHIQSRDALPIVCGGTGFWVQALLEGTSFPEVKPDPELRKKLEKKTAGELFEVLRKKDPRRAATIDPHNKIRLIRALEVVQALGKVPSLYPVSSMRYPVCLIALNPDQKILHKNIEKRLEKRLKEGMIEEVERLRKEGLSWKRLESFGLEYKNIALYLQKKISRNEMKERILIESRQYAKRQLTWLRRWEKQGTKIHWTATEKEALKMLKTAAF